MSEKDESAPVPEELPLVESHRANVPDPTFSNANTGVTNAQHVERYHLIPDLYRGVVKGAYAADRLHSPGMMAWIIVGFIPGLGTFFALRDGYYSVEVRDRAGLLLNLIGLLPFMKGFSNIIDVAFVHRVHRMAHTTHTVLHVARHGRILRAGSRGPAAVFTGGAHGVGSVAIAVNKEHAPSRNRSAWPAVLLALLSAVLSPILMVLLVSALEGSAYFGYVLPLPLPIAITAVAMLWTVGVLILAVHARSTAKKMRGQPFSRGGVSLVALCFAVFGVLVSLLVSSFVLYAELMPLARR
jgi:hypothetical protein